MIKSLPALPKSMKYHTFYAGWRRKAGVLRIMFLRSKDAYKALSEGTLETEHERQQALSTIIRYTQYASVMDTRVNTGNVKFELLDFIHNDENWND